MGGKGLPGKSSSASAARGVFDRSTEDAGRSAPKSPVDKVDMPDVHNPQAVIPYLHDIHRHYREAEARPPTSTRAPAPHRTHRLCCARPALSAKPSGPTRPALGARGSPRAESRAPPPQAINLASGTYMSKQNDINEKMRAILIDWLIEVHLKFKLMIETLYLTVNLIDRFLEKETITRNKLQLVGVTAMFLASKYEEIYAPECRDFVYISDKAYTREQILAMEGAVLAKLNFQLTTPNTYVFLKRFSKVAGIIATPRSKTELLANMFVELTLQARAPALSLSKRAARHTACSAPQEYKFLKYLPSMVAASAVYLALKTMGQPCWVRQRALAA